MRMNHLFILGLLSVGLTASTNIKKTFVMHRPKIDNMAIEKSGVHEHLKFKTKYGMNFQLQAAPFASAAIKGEDVGKYYGVNGTNNINIAAGTAAAVIASDTIDISNRFLIHDSADATSNDLRGDFNLNPKQEAYGIRFDLFGFLKNPFPKTFYKISLPLVYIENDMHIKYNYDVADDGGDKISDFFTGQVINSGVAADLQDSLTAGKIQDRRATVFGIADIDAHFGYRLVENKKREVRISALITIPTGNRPSGEFLFEPIYGNGNHFALGWNIDGNMRLWKKKRHTGTGYFSLTHKYLFDGTEKRVIPLDFMSYPFAHYYLGGTINQVATTPLFPLANILNQDVRVRPGNLVEGVLGLKFKTKRFDLDAGYNIFYKEKENLTLKTAWTDDTYAIANDDYSTAGVFNTAGQLLTINNENLDIDGAATPNQLTHKAFGAISYKFKVSGHPTSISLGGSYEFADNNFELEGYEFWFKASVNF